MFIHDVSKENLEREVVGKRQLNREDAVAILNNGNYLNILYITHKDKH